MLNRINVKEIGFFTTIKILFRTSIKIIRGLLNRPFFKQAKGLTFIGKNVTLTEKNKITIGKNVKFESGAEVQGLSKRGLSFGDNVTIGRNVMIRPSSYYGIDLGEGFSIGNNSSIGPLGYIGCAGYIKIGDNVMMGPRVSMFAENHNFRDDSKTIKEQGVCSKGIVIEDNCWIGSGVIILDGVTIGAGSVIAAGTIVTKDVAPNSVVKDRRDKDISERMRSK